MNSLQDHYAPRQYIDDVILHGSWILLFTIHDIVPQHIENFNGNLESIEGFADGDGCLLKQTRMSQTENLKPFTCLD